MLLLLLLLSQLLGGELLLRLLLNELLLLLSLSLLLLLLEQLLLVGGLLLSSDGGGGVGVAGRWRLLNQLLELEDLFLQLSLLDWRGALRGWSSRADNRASSSSDRLLLLLLLLDQLLLLLLLLGQLLLLLLLLLQLLDHLCHARLLASLLLRDSGNLLGDRLRGLLDGLLLRGSGLVGQVLLQHNLCLQLLQLLLANLLLLLRSRLVECLLKRRNARLLRRHRVGERQHFSVVSHDWLELFSAEQLGV